MSSFIYRSSARRKMFANVSSGGKGSTGNFQTQPKAVKKVEKTKVKASKGATKRVFNRKTV